MTFTRCLGIIATLLAISITAQATTVVSKKRGHVELAHDEIAAKFGLTQTSENGNLVFKYPHNEAPVLRIDKSVYGPSSDLEKAQILEGATGNTSTFREVVKSLGTESNEARHSDKARKQEPEGTPSSINIQ